MVDFNTLDEEIQNNWYKYFECRLQKINTANFETEYTFGHYIIADEEHYLGYTGLGIDHVNARISLLVVRPHEAVVNAEGTGIGTLAHILSFAALEEIIPIQEFSIYLPRIPSKSFTKFLERHGLADRDFIQGEKDIPLQDYLSPMIEYVHAKELIK